MDVLLALDEERLMNFDNLSVVALASVLFLILVCLLLLQRQPTEQKKLSFKVS